jgi:hypothetical protein
MGVDPRLGDAGLDQALDPDIEQGTTGDRDETLGDLIGEGA